MSRSLVADVFRHLEGGYPCEACGVFLGRRDGEDVAVAAALPVPNVDTERARDRYEMDPRALLAAEKEARAKGLAVVGIWHSHPDHPARPSETDLARAWPEYVYLIAAVRKGRAAEWTCWTLNEAASAFEPVVTRLTGPGSALDTERGV